MLEWWRGEERVFGRYVCSSVRSLICVAWNILISFLFGPLLDSFDCVDEIDGRWDLHSLLHSRTYSFFFSFFLFSFRIIPFNIFTCLPSLSSYLHPTVVLSPEFSSLVLLSPHVFKILFDSASYQWTPKFYWKTKRYYEYCTCEESSTYKMTLLNSGRDRHPVNPMIIL